MPGGIAEDPAVRPRLLRTLLIADPGTGRVQSACAIEAPSFEEELARRFVEAALGIGFRPRRVLVRRIDVRDLLAPVAKALDTAFLRVRYLPALEGAEDALKEYMERNPMGSR